MTLNDPLANALSKINNAEGLGKRSCTIKPVSKVILSVLEIMNQHGMIGAVELSDISAGKIATVHLIGKVNKCGAIKPRYAVKKTDFEKFEKRYLPAKGFGIILVSTSAGILTHTESKNKLLGGRLLAYSY